MSRYIDADALNIYDVSPAYGFVVMGVTEEDIDLAPSIDIVRCRECKYYDDEDYGEPTRYCTWHESVVKADDFCSYGERSE